MTLTQIASEYRSGFGGEYFKRPNHANKYTFWQNTIMELIMVGSRPDWPRLTVDDLNATNWEFVE